MMGVELGEKMVMKKGIIMLNITDTPRHKDIMGHK
jgi:hypothetical protein